MTTGPANRSTAHAPGSETRRTRIRGADEHHKNAPVLHIGAVGWAILLGTLLALALRLYEVTRPGLLLGVPQYDDAIYYGSALRLLDGFVPYRDFAFVQPPGISVLLTPVALLAKITGTDAGLAVARVLTACAGAASVLLGGLLVRHVNLLAVVIVCGILAIHPDSAGAAQSVFLEPWLVVFCLLGALAAFDHGGVTPDRRRMIWAGVAFGIAGSIKVWAVVPIVVLTTLLFVGRRRAVLPFLGGLCTALTLVVGPFVAAAPHAFFENVVVAQLARVDMSRIPVPVRLNSLFGLTDLSLSSQGIVAVVLAVTIVIAFVAAAAWAVGKHQPSQLELFALLSGAVAFIMFLWPVDYYVHYAAFFALFLALTVALVGARLLEWWESELTNHTRSTQASTALRAVLAVGLVVALAWGAILLRQHEAALRGAGPPLAAERIIPVNACILTDYPAYTVAANRFDVPHGCSPMLDPLGEDFVFSHGRNALTGAGNVPAVLALWLSAFRHAKYVWLSCAPPRAKACNVFTNRRVPWTAGILNYFLTNFRHLQEVPGNLYIRVS